MPKNRVEIVVGIIKRGRDVLIAKRPKNKAFPSKWEFPGGKIEPGESPKECLAREIGEELGVSVVILESIGVRDLKYSYPVEQTFRCHCYLCKITGEPQLLIHEDLKWVDVEQLTGFDLLEGDRMLLPLICEKMKL